MQPQKREILKRIVQDDEEREPCHTSKDFIVILRILTDVRSGAKRHLVEANLWSRAFDPPGEVQERLRQFEEVRCNQIKRCPFMHTSDWWLGHDETLTYNDLRRVLRRFSLGGEEGRLWSLERKGGPFKEGT